MPSSKISEASIFSPRAAFAVASPADPPNASIPAPAAAALVTAAFVTAPVADFAADLVSILAPTDPATFPV